MKYYKTNMQLDFVFFFFIIWHVSFQAFYKVNWNWFHSFIYNKKKQLNSDNNTSQFLANNEVLVNIVLHMPDFIPPYCLNKENECFFHISV